MPANPYVYPVAAPTKVSRTARAPVESMIEKGITLRDHFAAAAIPYCSWVVPATGAAQAYAIADAMLAERES